MLTSIYSSGCFKSIEIVLDHCIYHLTIKYVITNKHISYCKTVNALTAVVYYVLSSMLKYVPDRIISNVIWQVCYTGTGVIFTSIFYKHISAMFIVCYRSNVQCVRFRINIPWKW